MPDKKDTLKEVTDPKLLEQLNGSPSSDKEVTDPSLLAQLNGETPEAQKKSPDVSASGSAASLQGGPQNSLPNSEPNAIVSNIGNPPPPVPEAKTPYDVIGSVFGKTPEGENIVDASKNIQPTPEATKVKTYQATKFLADDAMQNSASLPAGYTQNYTNPNTAEPGNLLHDITNPHGDPLHTGAYAQTRVAQLEQQKQKAIQDAGYNNSQLASGLSDYGLSDINKQYNDQIAQVKSNASQVISAQLFNKEYAQKPLSDAEAATKLDALEKQRDADIKSANDQMAQSLQGENKYNIEGADRQRQDKIKQINNRYNSEALQVKNSEKWDAVRLGIEHQKLLGDQDAIRDAANLQSGKPISPAAKYKYQLAGNEILKTGSQLAEANGQTPVAQQAQSHIKTDKQLENENLDYFVPQWEQAIGNAKYADENTLLRTIVPHLGSMSKDDVEKYGEQSGLTKSQIAKVDPEKVPTSATLWQQAASGALNTAAPLYENFIGSPLMRASGASEEEINQRFQPGWENQRGLGAAIVGNIPSDQNSFHNVRGALGQVLSGAAGLATFGGEVGAAAKGAEALGLASDAAKAEKLANFGVMSFNGYNSAYRDANEAIGDKPEDEWKRQAYAATRGILEGMIFSGGSKYELAKNAFGEAMGKSGDELLDEIKNAKDVGVLQAPTFKEAIVKKIMSSGEELGKQVKLSVANDMAKDVVNTIVNPNKKQDISDDIKNTAISTSLAMLIPSIMGGVGHVNNETPLNTATAFEIGSHPQQYLESIDKQYQDGKISRQDLSTLRGAIGAMQYSVNEAPTETPDGQKLTPDQIKSYAFNRFQEHLLLLKQDQINKTATDNKMQPDKALLDPINKRISELEKQRGDILKNAGQLRPPTPQPEEVNQTPEAERSVATEPQSESQTPETKKPEKKVAESEKENIPLSSDITSQSKTEDHGNNDEEKIVNNGTDNKGQEVNANGEKNADNKGAEDRQNGPLVPPGEEEQNKEQPQAAEMQPLPVEGKRPVKKFGLKPKPEEQIPIQKNDAFEAMDLGNEGGKPIEEVKAKVDAADPYEKIGGGESFDDFKERIRKAWQKTKKTAEDQTLLQTHSGVMRMIESAEKHGWTDTEALKRAYDATEEPEVGEKHTYKTDKGEIHVMRHGESEDLKAELARRPEDVLTPEGQRQAKEDIAGHLKEEGITPPAIIADGMPRTAETAEIVRQELAKPENEHPELAAINKEFEGKKKAITDVAQKKIDDLNKKIQERDSDTAEKRRQKENYDEATSIVSKMGERADGGLNISNADNSDVPKLVMAMAKMKILGGDGERIQDYVLNAKHKDIVSTIENQQNNKPEEAKINIVKRERDDAIRKEETRRDYDYSEKQKELAAKEKPQEKTPSNGAIATPDQPEPELPSQKTGKQLDEISKQIAEQQAIIKKSFDSIPKDGEDKMSAWQDHLKENEKQIEQLKKQFNALEQRQRIEQYKERDETASGKLANYIEDQYAKNKKAHEGEVYSGIIGLSTKIGNHVADFVVARVVEGRRSMQTVEMAIRRAIRQAKEKYGKEAEDLSEKDINAIKEHLDLNEKVPSHEPSLPFDYEDDVKGIKDDIQAGRSTYEDAVHDVMNGEYYNRAGELLSDHNAENVKDKILAYLNWHEEGRQLHNAQLADADNKNRVISDYGLKNGDAMTRMLSGNTIELRTGDEPLNEQQAVKYSLEGAALDAQAMVSKMKHHFGNDVTEYGPEMLKQIDKLPGGDTVKRVTALLGLMDELRKDQDIYEDHLASLSYSDKDVAERRATNERLSQIPKLLKKAEKTYQETQREASKTINTGRIMAKLFSGKFAHELLADEAILPDKDREAKKQIENKLADTKIPDAVAKQGALFSEKEADAAVEEAQRQMAKKEKPEGQKDSAKEKAKNVVKKVTEVVTKKKVKDKAAVEQMKKDAEAKLAKKGMNESNMFDKIKDLLKKNPC